MNVLDVCTTPLKVVRGAYKDAGLRNQPFFIYITHYKTHLMEEISRETALLLEKLNRLIQRQNTFSQEISELKAEILSLSKKETTSIQVEEKVTTPPLLSKETIASANEAPPIIEKKPFVYPTKPQPSLFKSNLEKFIGENLINKIGIAIVILGVAIGVQYSIEHDLISPAGRVALGYLVGLGLLIVGLKLKKNYLTFSAVLVSGALAIFYFMTYAAYSFYDLLPQLAAFSVMVGITIATVFAAVKLYNLQIIAIIGLVGAYAIPTLLSNGSGKVEVLFSYIAIINVGILFIAFKKDWARLFHTAFVVSWLAFFGWFEFEANMTRQSEIALGFSALFFGIFHIMLLNYKRTSKVPLSYFDTIILFANAFIFYGVCLMIFSTQKSLRQYQGLMTVAHALLHTIIGGIMYLKSWGDKSLKYVSIITVVTLLTIAIPAQFEGHWITLLWTIEAAALLWIGRVKNISTFELLAYPLILLAFFSNSIDLSSSYDTFIYNKNILAFGNINFMVSISVAAILGIISFIHFKNKSTLSLINRFIPTINVVFPLLFVFTLFAVFTAEIDNFWTQKFDASTIIVKSIEANFNENTMDYLLIDLKDYWLLNFTLFYITLLGFINLKWIKAHWATIAIFFASLFVLLLMLTQGLYLLSDFRDSYLAALPDDDYPRSIWLIWQRYLSIALIGATLYLLYRYAKTESIVKRFPLSFKLFELLLATVVIWVASSELITWMSIAKNVDAYRFGMSVLWGAYSLLLIALGIWKSKQHLRIAAIALFSITLIKLFVYDVSHLETIAKTVIFVSLGLLLLIISFLYNKYKNLIGNEKKD
jgi:uncharacterized membrane protein